MWYLVGKGSLDGIWLGKALRKVRLVGGEDVEGELGMR